MNENAIALSKKVSWQHMILIMVTGVAWISGIIGFGFHEYSTGREAMAKEISELSVRSHGNELLIREITTILKFIREELKEQNELQKEILKKLKEK